MNPDSCEEMDEARRDEKHCFGCYWFLHLSEGAFGMGVCNNCLSDHKEHAITGNHLACEEFKEKIDDPNK